MMSSQTKVILPIQLLLVSLISLSNCLLHVQKNEIRTFDSLDGLWTFVREPHNGGDIGIGNQWNTLDLEKFNNATVMPVPCAYNDIGTSSELRDHIGWVWYEKKEFVPLRDRNMRHVLRFASVNYFAVVYVNSEKVTSHTGGHLPFEVDVSSQIKFGAENKFTVAVNNTLSWSTIPQGDFNYQRVAQRNISGRILSRLPDGAVKNVGNFDFFNYAGILRSVQLVKIPSIHIQNINIVADHTGSFYFETAASSLDGVKVEVKMFDSDGNVVYSTNQTKGEGKLENAKLWWPRGMGDPNLYNLEISLISDGELVDIYRETFGFRTVTWSDSQIFINSKPFYCLGFGMHEDFELIGRGFNQAVMTKDLNLLEWMGGNCYRTTHYPYSEERMFENDRRGIAVIVETPAVGLKGFSKANNNLHVKMLTDMIDRDKNHPSVFAWSLANEPNTNKKESRAYFKTLVDAAHGIDRTRPVTTVYGPTNFDNDETADLMDFICVNRYYGWYIDMGYIPWINQSVYWDISLWRETFHKPIIVTEYGADSIPGLNQEPSVDFSEQYQNEVIQETHHAFDALHKDHTITGEMIWNFADFMTGMTTTRAVGNHKGVFTRSRQAKISAYTLRNRYLKRFDQSNLEIWD
ncbi:hypothetical protein CRE_14244 [Caenorhabditis remanei]|uniref:Beta-glucuronidase n=1 Tax=Caenorhabditis remanei TaxID=31234 RepID=E3N1P8_CAERE|nr:hypothetical protein CRE_14244 [Caenorhabditis remanei]